MARIHTKPSLYLIVLLILMFSGCGSEIVEDTEENELAQEMEDRSEDESDANKEMEVSQDMVETVLDNMSLEEKAGQVLMPAFRKDEWGAPIQTIHNNLQTTLNQLKPGGIILFSENIRDEQQLKALIQDLQETSDISLLIAVDEEGGRVSRLTGKEIVFPELPGNRALGLTKDLPQIRNSGKVLGKRLRELGFNMNMAPVADVDSNPANPVIGERSFGSDPELVATLAVTQAEGMMEEGVIPVFKHFPGHGDTGADTHFGQVVLPHTRERMEKVELVPFQKGIDHGIPVIMTAHLMVPAYDESHPATLSEAILTDLLRGKMGFKGLIVTDALEMAAISNEWDSGEAAVMALKAGADLLLMPSEPLEAHKAIIAAVKKERLSEERLDESVVKILRLKKEYKLTIGTLENKK